MARPIGGAAVFIPSVMKNTELVWPAFGMTVNRVESLLLIRAAVMTWAVQAVANQWTKFVAIGNLVDRIANERTVPAPPPYDPPPSA